MMLEMLSQAATSLHNTPLAEVAIVLASGIYALDRVLDRLGVGRRNGNGYGNSVTTRHHEQPCAPLQVLQARFVNLEQKVDAVQESVNRLHVDIQELRLELVRSRRDGLDREG